MSSSNVQYIRWHIFAGILFSVAGMCLLNYYSLFPDVDKRDEEMINNNNNDDDGNNKKQVDKSSYDIGYKLVYKT